MVRSSCSLLSARMGVRIAVIEHEVLRPGEFDALLFQPRLKVAQAPGIGMHRVRRHTAIEAMVHQQPCRFADVPLHGMEPLATICDVRGADVLGRRQQILHPLREQRA